ncbi:MAG: hypothetical protein IPN13_01345 [Bacteroidetes bacterium]|nr:hypothetical protein [Bacteroidota bacterium]
MQSIDTSLFFDNPWLSPINWVDSTTYYWIDCTTGAIVENDFSSNQHSQDIMPVYFNTMAVPIHLHVGKSFSAD